MGWSRGAAGIVIFLPGFAQCKRRAREGEPGDGRAAEAVCSWSRGALRASSSTGVARLRRVAKRRVSRGLATLKEIAKPGFFDALATKTRALVQGLESAARDAGVAFIGDSEGGMFGFFFADELPQNYGVVMGTDKERFNRFFHAMLDRGVYLAPALYEAGFVSAAHSEADIAATVQAAAEALRA